MKNNKIFFFLFILILFNCKKEDKINILELTDLNKYKISKIKTNDSIVKINGDNKDYSLKGTINSHNHSKQDWWIVKNKSNGEEYKIEYIFLDKQIENQIKIYKKGMLYKSASKFYTASFENNGFNFNFYFPISKFKTRDINFDYTVSDTIKRIITKQGKLDCKKDKDHYSCFVPVGQNESVIGIVTNFSNFKEKDSVTLAVDRMFVEALKK